MIGRLLSFREGLFSGDMLALGRVSFLLIFLSPVQWTYKTRTPLDSWHTKITCLFCCLSYQWLVWLNVGASFFPSYLQHEAPLFAGNFFGINWGVTGWYPQMGNCQLVSKPVFFCLTNGVNIFWWSDTNWYSNLNFGSYFDGVKIILQKKPMGRLGDFRGFFYLRSILQCPKSSLDME